MVGHILPADLAPTLGVGSKFNFFRTWSCCISYQIKWNHECSNMAANILVVPTSHHHHPPPPPTEGVGSKSIFFRTWSCCISSQIKWNAACSNMVATTLPADSPPHPPPPDPGMESQVLIQLFQNMVMLHIKLNGITNAATWNKYFARRPPPPHTHSWGRGHNSTFSEHGRNVAYQSECNREFSNMQTHILSWGGVKGQNNSISESSHFAHQV